MVANVAETELWGGVECTINRVGNRYFNQLESSGHRRRGCADLARFAALGLRALRFPVLWESVAPNNLVEFDWSWTDQLLEHLNQLGIRPIVGLLHHGSGPRYTHLLDPDFPTKFARFAAAVAERYPWVDTYTPVNEPLTTARFSSLYGYWYPHARNERAFGTALINQLRATVLAMREIRAVNPAAQLLQTEDFGRTFSTPRLQYQADFDNTRRWLTWDLLRGELASARLMRPYFEPLGPGVLNFFLENPCPPDLIGINYYVTSERYLDENIDAYPPEYHGGNGRERYADDGAVRARREELAGFSGAIAEVWERYRSPIVLSEVHLGCYQQIEQLRWFKEAWHAANEARSRGIDIRAVTAWALLGGFDWDSLVTNWCGNYEPGVFDVSDGEPYPTRLAGLIAKLALSEAVDDPKIDQPGWWKQPSRLRFPAREELLVW